MPTVLVGAGYGRAGSTSPGRDVPGEVGTGLFLAAGYNVLTWDPRGLGGSGGTVMFNSPDFEARDVAALIDFVAAQPEALLNRVDDPRVGMAGFSYVLDIENDFCRFYRLQVSAPGAEDGAGSSGPVA